MRCIPPCFPLVTFRGKGRGGGRKGGEGGGGEGMRGGQRIWDSEGKKKRKKAK